MSGPKAGMRAEDAGVGAGCWCLAGTAEPEGEPLTDDQWQGEAECLTRWKPADVASGAWLTDTRRRIQEALLAWGDPMADRARFELQQRLWVHDEHFSRAMLDLLPYSRRSGIAGETATTRDVRRELQAIRYRCAAAAGAISTFAGDRDCPRCEAPIGANAFLEGQSDLEALCPPSLERTTWRRRVKAWRRAQQGNIEASLAAEAALDDLKAIDGRGGRSKAPAEILARVLVAITRRCAPPPPADATKGQSRKAWRRDVANFVYGVTEAAGLPTIGLDALRRILHEAGALDTPPPPV